MLTIDRGRIQHQQDLLQQTHDQIQNQEVLIDNQQHILSMLRTAVTQQGMPNQVYFSSPVISLDTLGRYMGFYLEFIDSYEVNCPFTRTNVAFRPLNFSRGIPGGLEDSLQGHRTTQDRLGEFVLEDMTRRQPLLLAKSWSTAVRPGQHISKSMVCRLGRLEAILTCPGCGEYEYPVKDDRRRINTGSGEIKLWYQNGTYLTDRDEKRFEDTGERKALIEKMGIEKEVDQVKRHFANFVPLFW